MQLLIYTFILSLMLHCNTAQAAVYHQGPYKLCFTPGGNCTSLITEQIQNSKTSIYLQAYSFTAMPIAYALVKAQQRGVKVAVIMDKVAKQSKTHALVSYLVQHGIPVWLDYRPAIAHNKVIILDKQTVITGSFNFTNAAQNHNAENLLVVQDIGIAQQYLLNWHKRQALSEPFTDKSTTHSTEQAIANRLYQWLYQQLYHWLKHTVNQLMKRASG